MPFIIIARSVIYFWNDFVGYVNFTVLQEKRDADSMNRSLWVLSNSDKQRVPGYAGPVFRIRKVSVQVSN